MNERRLLDSNFILRFLIQDHTAHFHQASVVFQACAQGDLTLILLPEVLSETVFVMESFYRLARVDIARSLSGLLTAGGVEITDRAVHIDALVRFQRTNLDFVDCSVAAFAVARNMKVASFDKDFRKFPDVKIDLD